MNISALFVSFVILSATLAPVQAQPEATSTVELDPQALPSTWQPWEWQGWEKFPSLYFAAEPEGLMNEDQLENVRRFSLAILEFRTGQFAEEETSGIWAGGDLGGLIEKQAALIKDTTEQSPPVLTYRSGMWAGSMFKDQWQALQDQSLFLKDQRLCDGFIDYPRDVAETDYQSGLKLCRWDMRNPDAVSVFQSMLESVETSQVNGLFLDNAHSVSCDESQHLSKMSKAQRKQFMVRNAEALAKSFESLVRAGKYPVLSSTIGFADIGDLTEWENDCPLSEEQFLAAMGDVPFARNNEFWMWNLGTLASKQVRNAIRETELGIPIIVHMPYFPKDKGCTEGCITDKGRRRKFSESEFLELGIAAFLVSMGPGSYFGFSDMQSDPEGGGWFNASWPYYDQYDDIITGAPLGPATVSDDGMVFEREFEKGRVWVDVAQGEYELGF